MTYTNTKWADRLNYLATIEPGWYEGYGDALSTEALDKANEILSLLDSLNFNVPGIFPLVEEGVIGMEWSHVGPGYLVSIQFTNDFQYEVYSINTKGRMEDDVSLETDSFEEAMSLLRKLLVDANLLTQCVTRD